VVIKRGNAQFAESTVKLADAQSKLKKGQAAVQQAEQIKSELEAETEKQMEIERSMASGDTYTWARQLMMDKARVGHEGINIPEVTKPADSKVGVLPDFPYRATVFTVRGSGHYHEIGTFLAGFENDYPYFQIRDLSLGPTPESGTSVGLSAFRPGEEKVFFKMDVVALMKPQE
jgi:hypothetical protein